ncbi:hypothetical protein BgAZ_500580 [Babesia gibsoni]|uniref:Uncharacterized protein n=1 Tax=Babesia gibsoni TaxID=33632 RepID=A0AAD8LM95_BABGI|nr:hypothetical protein BgAZ_500580 [Babesia gibsoni]
MTYSRGKRYSSCLLVYLVIQVTLLLTVSCVKRRHLSHKSHGIVHDGLRRSKHTPAGRHYAFVLGPVAVESHATASPLTPKRSLHAIGVFHRDDGHIGDDDDILPGNILRILWNSVKGLFSGLADGVGIPLVPDVNKLPAAHGHHIIPLQNLKALQALNMPLAFAGVDHTGGNLGPDASPYAQLIRSQPSVVMNKFLEKASQRVRDAAKSTVGALVGSFYRYCIETTMITSSDRLSVLIHSMQMTGYMLWNAECRFCLSQQLVPEPSSQDDEASAEPDPQTNAKTINVIPQFRDELVQPYGTDSLLNYIKQMPDQTANALLDNMTTGVIDAMQESTEMTVESLTGVAIGQQQPGSGGHHRVIVQQTGTSCVQLCLWHLALGYCLRDQEAKIELQNALKGA